jgi:hypothetical protein
VSAQSPNRHERFNAVWNAVTGAQSCEHVNWPPAVKVWGDAAPANAGKLVLMAGMIGRRHTNHDIALCTEIADSVSWGGNHE